MIGYYLQVRNWFMSESLFTINLNCYSSIPFFRTGVSYTTTICGNYWMMLKILNKCLISYQEFKCSVVFLLVFFILQIPEKSNLLNLRNDQLISIFVMTKTFYNIYIRNTNFLLFTDK